MTHEERQQEAEKLASICLAAYITELEQRIARVCAYLPEQQLAVEFLAQFPEPPDVPDEYRYCPRTRVSLTLDAGTVQALMINYDVTTAQDILAPLAWLSARLGSRPKLEESPELQRRAYVWTIPGNPARTVRFQVFFRSRTTGATCKFVQVGVTEQPVYKLMCDDKTELEAITP